MVRPRVAYGKEGSLHDSSKLNGANRRERYLIKGSLRNCHRAFEKHLVNITCKTGLLPSRQSIFVLIFKYRRVFVFVLAPFMTN